jgi:hypothetical protein
LVVSPSPKNFMDDESEHLVQHNQQNNSTSQTLNQILEEERIIVQEEEDLAKENQESSSFSGAVFNLVNATIGAGILGVPFVIKQTGLIFGLMFLCIGAVAGFVSLSYLRAGCEFLF